MTTWSDILRDAADGDPGELDEAEVLRGEAMTGTFKLSIELGNAEMQSTDDIADALIVIAEDVRSGRDYGQIRDLNGNTVGMYSVE
jgi:hypothetical protein